MGTQATSTTSNDSTDVGNDVHSLRCNASLSECYFSFGVSDNHHPMDRSLRRLASATKFSASKTHPSSNRVSNLFGKTYQHRQEEVVLERNRLFDTRRHFRRAPCRTFAIYHFAIHTRDEKADMGHSSGARYPELCRVRTSYFATQYYISLTWNVRLNVSRRLYSPGCSKVLTYDEVLQYTHQLTQALHSVPEWNDIQEQGSSQNIHLVSAFLKLQLIELILAMHRPYLQRQGEKFWLSENICYQMSRDVILLSTSLASSDYQRLIFLREDLLVGALCLARISLLQPKGS
mgnify:CR=1 FL=1